MEWSASSDRAESKRRADDAAFIDDGLHKRQKSLPLDQRAAAGVGQGAAVDMAVDAADSSGLQDAAPASAMLPWQDLHGSVAAAAQFANAPPAQLTVTVVPPEQWPGVCQWLCTTTTSLRTTSISFVNALRMQKFFDRVVVVRDSAAPGDEPLAIGAIAVGPRGAQAYVDAVSTAPHAIVELVTSRSLDLMVGHADPGSNALGFPLEQIFFSSVPASVAAVIQAHSRREWEYCEPAHYWVLDAGSFRPVEFEVCSSCDGGCSSRATLRPLTLQAVQIINDTWHYKSDTSMDLIASLIQHSMHVGMYVREPLPAGHANPEGSTECEVLAAWALVQRYGAIGMLYTLPQYRRRHYGEAVVSSLARAMLRQGLTPSAAIVDTNDPSQRLFERLGFRKTVLHVWAKLKS